MTQYSVQYSVEWNDAFIDISYKDGHPWLFNGNVDSSTEHTNFLPAEIAAGAVSIIPRQWQGGVSMRLEVYGCYLRGKLVAGLILYMI